MSVRESRDAQSEEYSEATSPAGAAANASTVVAAQEATSRQRRLQTGSAASLISET